MKYAACAFNDKPGARTYDYAVPGGLDIQPGDVVRVPAARGDGFQKVHVVEVKSDTSVKREWLKTIIEKHEAEEDDKAEV